MKILHANWCISYGAYLMVHILWCISYGFQLTFNILCHFCKQYLASCSRSMNCLKYFAKLFTLLPYKNSFTLSTIVLNLNPNDVILYNAIMIYTINGCASRGKSAGIIRCHCAIYIWQQNLKKLISGYRSSSSKPDRKSTRLNSSHRL